MRGGAFVLCACACTCSIYGAVAMRHGDWRGALLTLLLYLFGFAATWLLLRCKR
jgi:hypothetical protein